MTGRAGAGAALAGVLVALLAGCATPRQPVPVLVSTGAAGEADAPVWDGARCVERCGFDLDASVSGVAPALYYYVYDRCDGHDVDARAGMRSPVGYGRFVGRRAYVDLPNSISRFLTVVFTDDPRRLRSDGARASGQYVVLLAPDGPATVYQPAHLKRTWRASAMRQWARERRSPCMLLPEERALSGVR